MTDQVDVLARNIWGEGRGTGYSGMQRIANVHVNRAHNPTWWGYDIVSVCLCPFQFSCRNIDNPNYHQLMSVTSSNAEFRVALSISHKAISGTLPDITNGADSYYAITLRPPPEWTAHPAEMTASDEWHVFYRTRRKRPSGNVSIHVSPRP